MIKGKRKYFPDSDRRWAQPGSGEPAVGEVGAPGSLGAMLRRARTGKGLAIDDVAQVLRIRPAYLHALEEGRYKDLPGATYALGFLRTYAEYLAIDPAQAVARFRAASSGTIPKSELYMPQPVSEGRIPGGAVLLLALVLAGGIYGGWYYASSTGRDLVDLVPPLPDRIAQTLSPGTEGEPAGSDASEEASRVAAPAEGPPDTVVPPAEAPLDTVVTPVEEPSPPASEADTAAMVASPAPQAETSIPPQLPSPQPASPQPASPELAAPEQVSPQPVAPQPAPPEPAPVQSVASPTAGEAAGSEGAEAPAAAASPPATEAATAAAEAGQPEDAAPLPPPPAAPAEPAQTAEAQPAEPLPTGNVYGTVEGATRIQLHATQDSWVQVRDAEGGLLFARVLRPGDVYRVPDRPGLKLVTGNAGGLVVSIDGVRRPAPMGETGKVLRDVALDPKGLGADS